MSTPLVDVPILFGPEAMVVLGLAERELELAEARLLKSFILRAEVRATVNGEPLEDSRRAVFEEDLEVLNGLTRERDSARERVAEGTRIYRFRALGFKAWRALKGAHPSKDPKLAFDVDSIAPTLLREASFEPKLTADMVEEILTSPDWSEGEVILLISGAVRAQA